jgi:cytosine/adenosine deaminase-related metal-dependent hydrolase
MDLAFSHATVLTFDDAFSVQEDCDVVIRDKRIAAIASGAARGAARTIDARDLIVLPGLLNAHTHSPENFSRGRDEASTLDNWLVAAWSHIDTLTLRELYVAALLGVGEMLRSGATALVDHFRQLPMRPEAIDAVAQAYEDAGVRAIVAPMVRDRVVPAGRTVPTLAEQVATIEEALARWRARSARVRIGFGPSAPNRCTDDMLLAVGDAARRSTAIIHTHVDEGRAESARCRELYGHSTVEYLRRLGLVSPALTIAHAVWIDPADVDTLAQGQAVVVHNPVSNMRLGDGIAPIGAMRRAGVPLAIATDGAASNDGQHYFEAIKLAVFLQRVSDTPPEEWMTPRDALRHAANHAAFGFPGGRLEVGAVADLVAVSKSSYALTPANDWHRQIVYGAPGMSVRYAAVGGDLLLDDGRITTFDEPAILAEARSLTQRLYAQPPR